MTVTTLDHKVRNFRMKLKRGVGAVASAILDDKKRARLTSKVLIACSRKRSLDRLRIDAIATA
jgi:hypothetical protein